MTTVDEIRAERERREKVAAERAAKIEVGLDLYADSMFVRRHDTRAAIMECETHWDACLVMIAYGREPGNEHS